MPRSQNHQINPQDYLNKKVLVTLLDTEKHKEDGTRNYYEHIGTVIRITGNTIHLTNVRKYYLYKWRLVNDITINFNSDSWGTISIL